VGVTGIRRAVRKHVEEETAGYAADLSRKLQTEIAQEPGRHADDARIVTAMQQRGDHCRPLACWQHIGCGLPDDYQRTERHEHSRHWGNRKTTSAHTTGSP
jgi:hypothetical protein